MLIMHYTPPGAGQSGHIMEVTPGFLSLCDVSVFVIWFSLHDGKGESVISKLIKRFYQYAKIYGTF